MAKPFSQITPRGSAAAAARLSGVAGCWWSSPKATIPVSLKTGRSALELCEIGEQGGLTADCGARLYAPGRKADPRLRPYLLSPEATSDSLMNSSRAKAPARGPLGWPWD